MSKKKPPEEAPVLERSDAGPEGEESQAAPAAEREEAPVQTDEAARLEEALAQAEDRFLRLAAEYDNYRKRTAREKETAWSEAKAQTALSFLPVYDNLERALKQDTADEAYKKGVEMTMIQLREVLEKLGITEIPALGQPFDPNLHNAVMHTQDEALGESTVAEVFQAGFLMGERVIRFASVKVAN